MWARKEAPEHGAGTGPEACQVGLSPLRDRGNVGSHGRTPWAASGLLRPTTSLIVAVILIPGLNACPVGIAEQPDGYLLARVLAVQGAGPVEDLPALVSNLCPANTAVATIMRSAGSRWKSSKAAACMAMVPSIGISCTPRPNKVFRMLPTEFERRILSFSTSSPISQKLMADTATSCRCHASSTADTAAGPKCVSSWFPVTSSRT